MRVVVISDSHGAKAMFRHIVAKHQEEADTVFFLGDGDDEFDSLEKEFPDIPFYGVCGNNDIGWDKPEERVVTIGSVRCLLMHGHRLPYTDRDTMLEHLARENQAQVALYGHSHVPRVSYSNGIHIMNPGSIYRPRGGFSKSYALLDITHSAIVPIIVPLLKI